MEFLATFISGKGTFFPLAHMPPLFSAKMEKKKITFLNFKAKKKTTQHDAKVFGRCSRR